METTDIPSTPTTVARERAEYLSSRDKIPNSAAVRFVETSASTSGHAAPVYSTQVDSFVTVSEAKDHDRKSDAMWHEADEELAELQALISKAKSKFNPTVSTNTVVLKDDSPRTCGWDEVVDEINNMAHSWKSQPHQQSSVMSIVDRVYRNSGALQAWIELLPGGDYGSTICGAFKLAIGATQAYGKAQETVLEALAEIPEKMDDARRYVEVYRDVQGHRLVFRSVKLFRAILRTLIHIMRFFVDKKRHKFFETVWHQESYKQSLRDSIADVEKCVQAVKDEARQCDALRGQANTQTLSDVADTSRRIEDLMQHLFTSFREELKGSMLSVSEDVGNSLTKALQLSPYDMVHVDYLTPGDPTSDSASQRSSFDSTRVCSRMPLVKQQSSNMAAASVASLVPLEEVLGIVRYDPGQTHNDLESIKRASFILSEQSKAKAVLLFQNQMFRMCIFGPSSGNLLVNGQDDLASAEGCSPLSLIALKLVHAASSQTKPGSARILTVQYFCSEHVALPRRDPAAWYPPSPISMMMMSLIGQLATQLQETGIKEEQINRNKLAKLKLKSLCRLFEAMVAELAADTVLLCIIDEIHRYETQALREDTCLAIQRLVELAARPGNARFKLLVTSRGRAKDIRHYFVDCTLNLPENVETNDASDWAISQMGSRLQLELEN